MKSLVLDTVAMSDHQLNRRIAALTGKREDYTGDYRAILAVIEQLGYETELVSPALESCDEPHTVRVNFQGIEMAGRSSKVARAACEALIRLVDFIAISGEAIKNGHLSIGVRSIPFSMALTMMCGGRTVRRHAWNEKCHVLLLQGTTTPLLVGTPIDGVPPEFFQSGDGSMITSMPRIQYFDLQQQSVTDWTPTATDMLAHDWMAI